MSPTPINRGFFSSSNLYASAYVVHRRSLCAYSGRATGVRRSGCRQGDGNGWRVHMRWLGVDNEHHVAERHVPTDAQEQERKGCGQRHHGENCCPKLTGQQWHAEGGLRRCLRSEHGDVHDGAAGLLRECAGWHIGLERCLFVDVLSTGEVYWLHGVGRHQR